MKKIVTFLSISLALLVLGVRLSPADQGKAASGNLPEYTSDGQLKFPAQYREWVYLTSGLNMSYAPRVAGMADHDMFDNVFVNPSSYQYFLQNGKWPDKTMFVLEVRGSVGKGSINNGGHYQSDVIAVESEIKDTARFPGSGWGFYAFGLAATGKVFPKTAACYTCHAEKGAVDNTFVQFYPTLLKIAKEKRTLSPAYVAAERGQ